MDDTCALACATTLDQRLGNLEVAIGHAYVLTNKRPEWLQALGNSTLQEDARRERLNVWEHIGTSRASGRAET